LEVVGHLDVGGDVPHSQEFRHVDEFREAGVHPHTALGGDLDLGDQAAEGSGEAVEVGDPDLGQQVRAQVAEHDVRLAHAVGNRGTGGERGDALVLAAQVLQLHVQVGGAVGAVHGHVRHVRRGVQVLVAVRLINHQIVDAGLLEGQAGVFGRLQRLQPLFGADFHSLQPTLEQPFVAVSGREHPVDGVDLLLPVGLLNLP
jgi:hypothetical protein